MTDTICTDNKEMTNTNCTDSKEQTEITYW
jgi:hypothetical protein